MLSLQKVCSSMVLNVNNTAVVLLPQLMQCMDRCRSIKSVVHLIFLYIRF